MRVIDKPLSSRFMMHYFTTTVAFFVAAPCPWAWPAFFPIAPPLNGCGRLEPPLWKGLRMVRVSRRAKAKAETLLLRSAAK